MRSLLALAVVVVAVLAGLLVYLTRAATAPAPPRRPGTAPPAAPAAAKQAPIVVKAHRPDAGPASAPVPVVAPPDLPADDFGRGVREVLPQIIECYGNAAEGPSGPVTVRLEIAIHGGRGRIDEARIEPDGDSKPVPSPRLEQCMLQVIAQADFPASGPDRVVEVAYPFGSSGSQDAGTPAPRR